MSKVMVLVCGDDAAAAPLVDAVVAGANSIRFTEVDVRHAPTRAAAAQPTSRRAPLESSHELSHVDAVVFVAANDATADDIRTLLHDAGHAFAADGLVFAVAGDAPSTMAIVAAAGAILVTEAPGASATERAQRLGRRVARLSGWVRHGLGHEAEHHHPHDHAHSHQH